MLVWGSLRLAPIMLQYQFSFMYVREVSVESKLILTLS